MRYCGSKIRREALPTALTIPHLFCFRISTPWARFRGSKAATSTYVGAAVGEKMRDQNK